MKIKRVLTEFTSKCIDSHPNIQITFKPGGFLLFYEFYELQKGVSLKKNVNLFFQVGRQKKEKRGRGKSTIF